jgi:hypothetical protein
MILHYYLCKITSNFLLNISTDPLTIFGAFLIDSRIASF